MSWVIIVAFIGVIYAVSFVNPTVALMLAVLAALDTLLSGKLAAKIGIGG